MTSTSAAPKPVLLVLLTLSYLLLELAFNARLLDVAGGIPDQEALDEVEFFGRLLSGAGLSLLLWKWSGATTKGLVIGLVRLAAISALAVPLMFWGQRALIDAIVDASSAPERASAAIASQLPVALIWQVADIADLKLSSKALDQPAGKTFLAVLPLLATHTPELLKSAQVQIRQLVATTVRQQMGTNEEMYNQHYVPLANQARDLFNNDYHPASVKLAEVQQQGGSADNLWRDYQIEVNQQPFTASSASPKQREQVIKILRSRGVNVPDGWRLNDREGFMAALSGEGQPNYRDKMVEFLGPDANVQPGLSWADFSSHSDVQKHLRTKFAKAYPDIPLPLNKIGMSASTLEFKRTVYDPTVENLVQKQLKRMRLDSASYEEGKDNFEFGRKAMRAVVVPPLALSFSLFFGIANLAGLFSAFVPGPLWARSLAKVAILGGIVLTPLVMANQISDSAAYRKLEASLRTNNLLAASALNWLVHAQPVYYSLGHLVHMSLPLNKK